MLQLVLLVVPAVKLAKKFLTIVKHRLKESRSTMTKKIMAFFGGCCLDQQQLALLT